MLYRTPFKHPEKNTFSKTGDTQGWALSRLLMQTTDNLVPHPEVFYFNVQGTIVQAAGAPKIGPFDFLRLLTLRLGRGSEKPKIRLAGEGIRGWNAAGNNWIERCGELPEIAANGGGSAVETAVDFRVPFHLDAPGLSDPDIWLWPSAAYRNGKIELVMANPASALDAKITWKADPTVKLEVTLAIDHEEHIGMEFEAFTLDGKGSTSEAIALDGGYYLLIDLCPPKFNGTDGGDDVTVYNEVSSLTYEAARLPAFSGTQLRTYLLDDYVISRTDNLIYKKRHLPLIGWNHRGEVFASALDHPSDWSILLDGTVSEKHRLLCVRATPRDQTDVVDLLRYYGHNPNAVSLQARVQPGRPISEAYAQFVGLKVKRGKTHTNLKAASGTPPRPQVRRTAG